MFQELLEISTDPGIDAKGAIIHGEVETYSSTGRYCRNKSRYSWRGRQELATQSTAIRLAGEGWL
jgi:hypothetical protein